VLKNDFSRILKNNNGIALMMVLTAITIMMAIMGDFDFETKINKIQIYNKQEKAQAKYNAFAGLMFSMARLRLYKESFNYIEKNENAKNFVKPELLNKIWNIPFAFPLPTTSKMTLEQKTAIVDFSKNSLIQGEMLITIKNVSNLLNLNLLRVGIKSNNQNNGLNNNESDPPNNNEEDNEFTIEKQLYKILQNAITREMEKDEEFADMYSDLDIQELLTAIKYFVSERGANENDPFMAQVSNTFLEEEITPKYGPMSSMSEIYLLPKWDDRIVELVKNEFGAHPSLMIDLNKITENMLRILIPEIDDEQIKEFFEYRDDPKNPHFFNSEQDFKNYIVNSARLMTSQDYEERFGNFKKNGLKFGPSPTLFQVISVGKRGRSEFKLVAYVTMPAIPLEKTDENAKYNTKESCEAVANKRWNSETNKCENSDGSSALKDPPTQLLNPRVSELIIN
jgi:hypothetical protein